MNKKAASVCTVNSNIDTYPIIPSGSVGLYYQEPRKLSTLDFPALKC